MIATDGTITIAVSGGVDSMTLAALAHRRIGPDAVRMAHATSPAVPAEAGERVRQFAADENWRLAVVDAGEFTDPAYRSNPVNRCFFCKSNLYRTLSGLSDGLVVSGANIDDLGDYRPGLEAARDHSVRHPYVEAGLGKRDVRGIAERLDLPVFARLPSSPCLSSRVETGISIKADDLALIDAVERWCRERLSPRTVRCRLRWTGFVIELDEAALADLDTAPGRSAVADDLRSIYPALEARPLSFEPYSRGSAFVKPADNTRRARPLGVGQ